MTTDLDLDLSKLVVASSAPFEGQFFRPLKDLSELVIRALPPEVRSVVRLGGPVKVVFYDLEMGKWRVELDVDGKRFVLGRTSSRDDIVRLDIMAKGMKWRIAHGQVIDGVNMKVRGKDGKETRLKPGLVRIEIDTSPNEQ